ncbi:histidinol dehydrogenase [Plesiomonas shigelloides]|uniref:histidinol dehydrogenase n=1 Tax=Plesiomonas shigelloides TaxID=703 RepID=UPI00143E4C10|nr:histidinol dehydrogenase [Plesiomonas shigelloides]QIY08184.1 histidinol dehydrogenase [Plesiomonas shigelloides]
MEMLNWDRLSPAEQQQALMRPAISAAQDISASVRDIVQQVQQGGDSALLALTERFDRMRPATLAVSAAEVDAAEARLSDEMKTALQNAYRNIAAFHEAQRPSVVRVETQPGVTCEVITRPVQSVGLYIPGGSAPLLSTTLMLGIPARIAGCPQVILCSPPPIADEILYVARLCGISQIFNVGGAQAIAAMAYGTESVPKADKIFGPGNAYVTEAKRQVSQDHRGAAMDMPAGPSEVLVIADANANPAFIASDLLSQAEHGPDSQVILLTPSQTLADAVTAEVDRQLALLPRATIAGQALAASRIILTVDLAQAVAISNQYGPEHLIIQTDSPRQLLSALHNAGSIFLGAWTPESAGDYASGTNHVLPTYGYTRTYSSLGLADFMKRMTVQELTADGLLALAPTVERMAAAEKLDAHRLAVTLRVAALNAGRSDNNPNEAVQTADAQGEGK